MEQTPQPKLVPGKRWGKSKQILRLQLRSILAEAKLFADKNVAQTQNLQRKKNLARTFCGISVLNFSLLVSEFIFMKIFGKFSFCPKLDFFCLVGETEKPRLPPKATEPNKLEANSASADGAHH